ncbi:MAG: nitrous oxide reductase family maturation protein NosD, partial [Anaerolineae bacterium]|nr:nitrous oxide reductase family maturation protein NosD [Anaerolineae bacterium]
MTKILLLFLFLWPLRFAEAGSTLVVSPAGPLTTIDAALEIARNGDTIEVHGGVYTAPLLIEKSVTLVGMDSPVIDGGGEGSLVVITAPDATLKGFILRNGGSVLHHEDTGITIQAARVLVEDNRLENVLFGIDFASAPDSIARRNTIIGQEHEEGLRGDGIRVWYSDGVQLLENEIFNSRDVLISYSNHMKIEYNLLRDNRYGIHFMYSNNVTVSHNIIENNSVGAFLMYSQNIIMEDNRFSHNRGTSGYGLAMKDMDGIVATGNQFIGNQVGLYLDNSPSLYDTYNYYRDNLFAYNDVGVVTLPSVERNVFQQNSFLGNLEHVGMWGREIENRNIWSQDGIGNYWSGYVGYDRNGDSIGDTPFRADKLFENLTDRYPVLKLFKYSPAAQTIEFTASAFPVIRPTAKVVDNAPLMTAPVPAHLLKPADSPISVPFLAFSLGLMLLAAGIFGTAFVNWHPTRKTVQGNTMIVVNNLVKKYGQSTV